jgi:hypothetical protein
MVLIFQGNIINCVMLNNIMDDDMGTYDIELFVFSTNIKKTIDLYIGFFFFLTKVESKNVHNMLCLMLDP